MNYYVRVSLDYILGRILGLSVCMSSTSLALFSKMFIFIYTTTSLVCPYVYTSSPNLGNISHLNFCLSDKSEMVFVVFICIYLIISEAERLLMFFFF